MLHDTLVWRWLTVNYHLEFAVNTPSEETMGDRIRELRKRRNMTLQELGDVFKISRSSVSGWESGATRPDPDKLPALARTLGTTIEYLISGTLIDLASAVKTTTLDGFTTTVTYTVPLQKTVVAPAHLSLERPAKRGDGRIPVLRWEAAGKWSADIKAPAATNKTLDLLRGKRRLLGLEDEESNPNERSVQEVAAANEALVEEWVSCPFRYSRDSYALVMDDHSCVNPFGKACIYEGDYVAVDPQKDYQNRDIVLVRQEGIAHPFIRRIFVTASDREILLALNEDWENPTVDVTPDMEVLGIVIGIWRSL